MYSWMAAGDWISSIGIPRLISGKESRDWLRIDATQQHIGVDLGRTAESRHVRNLICRNLPLFYVSFLLEPISI